ncbi:S8 family peptidase [Weeksellaceae bacterium TAE3-ERU29]|nr:S8 family peptidase [Weeksellaceae bacterium TAE3-ERU29]
MKKLSLSLALVAGLLFAQAQEKVSPEELAKQNWFHANYAQDSIYGVASDAAYEYAQAKGLKSNPIIVAVIDSGIEPDHDDLKNRMWVNKGEIPNNGIDDDNNGYIDDIHGWNFIGGPEGDVNHDNLEITRLVREGKKLFETEDEELNLKNQKEFKDKYVQYLKILPKFQKELEKNKAILANVEMSIAMQIQAIDAFINEYGADRIVDEEGIKAFKPNSDGANQMKQVFLAKIEEGDKPSGKTAQEIKDNFLEGTKEATDYYSGKVNYYYNINYDSRGIVGDNYEDVTERFYGNNTTEGPDALHGTHVAGIIGAERNNGIGMNGVADNVKIMNVRTVPDGDERDKDVANAIRYAVDNGAKVINMSFGKGYSPHKDIVWEAMEYATNKGVLLVKAAGNDNADIDTDIHYPTNFRDGKKVSNTLLTVGASSRYNDKLKASFSNYGKVQVDIFAPGLEIYSTVPDNTYRYLQGTSMASPVVAGVAALVWSYFPNLTAQELRDILISTGNYNETLAEISTNGVVVDALKALKAAEKLSASKGNKVKKSKKRVKR